VRIETILIKFRANEEAKFRFISITNIQSQHDEFIMREVDRRTGKERMYTRTGKELVQ
jgi:hypothetical protein